MNNQVLKIILTPRENRSISDSFKLIGFWRSCTQQEFKYALQIVGKLQTN